MSKDLFHICLTEEPLVAPPAEAAGTQWGARITFAGVVRGNEGGRPISGIDYTAYVPMAEKVLRRIAEDGKARFPGHILWLEHRIGFVPAGDTSLYLTVATPHSAEGFEISRWYLQQVKSVAPIWKEPRFTAEAAQRRERCEGKR